MITFDLVTVKGQCQSTVILKALISYKGTVRQLINTCMLLLDTYIRKPYMGSPMTLSHLTLSDIERSKSRSLCISRKGTKLGHMLLFTINRKTYVGSPFVRLHLTFKLVTLLKG